jgi:lactoylglutathione lyase
MGCEIWISRYSTSIAYVVILRVIQSFELEIVRSMKFSHPTLFVQDVLKAIALYEKAFGLTQRFIHESGQFAELEANEITLHFAASEAVKYGLPQGFQENNLSNLPAGIALCFVADDVAAAFSLAVEAGATVHAAPTVKPWGQTVAYVRDLDGILIEIGNASW